MLYRIVDWYWSLRRIIVWLPVLWNDRDRDYNYLYQIITLKLSQMEQHHREERVIADWERVANELKRARLHLERLIKDDYFHYETNWRDNRNTFENQARNAEQQKKDDLNGFAGIFVKHSRGWWS